MSKAKRKAKLEVFSLLVIYQPILKKTLDFS